MILIKFAFWMVVAVILCCFTCACTDAPSQAGDTPSEPSINDKTPMGNPEKSPFETAWNDLSEYDSTGTLNLTDMTVHQIHGSGVDAGGNANSWILGIQQNEASSLLVYENDRWRQVAWGEPFWSPAIDVQAIVFPTQLYEQNRQKIEEAIQIANVTESELDLSGEMYTISLRLETGISLLRFNATTGESL